MFHRRRSGPIGKVVVSWRRSKGVYKRERNFTLEVYCQKKWYQIKKTLLFQGSGAKQVEEAICNTIKQTSSSPEQQMCSRFENSNLHNNDKHCEP